MRKVKSRDEFREAMNRERAVCDRKKQEFSVVAFDLTSSGEPHPFHKLVHVLSDRIRQTDDPGWLDRKRVGVLLPDTSSLGARTLARDVCRTIGRTAPNYSIYTYPGEWPPGEKSERPDELITGPTPIWKRLIDMIGAGAGLFFLWPLLLLIAAGIKVSSPGPAFLRQKRVGRHGKFFTLWKFRTMHVNADVNVHQSHFANLMSSDTPMTKLDAKRDPRIFPFGRILRRLYLDELPQLINVFRGDMSLVGPRPCLPYEAEEYSQWQTRRFDAVPGMTGLWQVNGKNRTTFKEMMRLDITYSKRQSLWLDVQVLMRTIPAILTEIWIRRYGKTTEPAFSRRPGTEL